MGFKMGAGISLFYLHSENGILVTGTGNHKPNHIEMGLGFGQVIAWKMGFIQSSVSRPFTTL